MVLVLLLTMVCAITPAMAQAPLPVPQAPPQGAPVPVPFPGPAPALYPPAELDRIVSPIALYPDPLLAQVFTAATFYPQIPDAARWADQHHYLTGPSLTAAIAADQLPWDPSVQALLAFPSVLDMMASAMPWTQEIGSAFLGQSNEVMDAVQRMRQRAISYGYLQSSPQLIVRTGPYIEILPANPDYIVVPYYDPVVVYAPPRRGFYAGGAIRFGFGVTLGASFVPWGWRDARFGWREHVVVHPYTVPRYEDRRFAEQHRLLERSHEERERERSGRKYKEEHHR
jgi:hypothetical protein